MGQYSESSWVSMAIRAEDFERLLPILTPRLLNAAELGSYTEQEQCDKDSHTELGGNAERKAQSA